MVCRPKTYLDLEAVLDGEHLHAGGPDATRRLLDVLELRPQELILEIGCGTGATAKWVQRQYGCSVFAVDISSMMLRRAARKIRDVAPVHLIQADAVRFLPFRSGSFDAVFAESVAGLLDFSACLPEWVRVLRPGGRLALNDGLWSSGVSPATVQKFTDLAVARFGYTLAPRTPQTVEDWKRMMASAGLIHIRSLTAATQSNVIVRDPQTRRRRRRAKLLRPHLWPALLRYRRAMNVMVEVSEYLEYWILVAEKA